MTRPTPTRDPEQAKAGPGRIRLLSDRREATSPKRIGVDETSSSSGTST